jgi:hypothetical protein
MKYTIVKGQQQEDVLTINGSQSICPFTAPLPFQGNMGQVQIMRMPCTTLCPHAVISDDNSNYIISCGNGRQSFQLDTTVQEEPKPTSKLFSL